MSKPEEVEALVKRLDQIEERLDRLFDTVNRLIDLAQGVERVEPGANRNREAKDDDGSESGISATEPA
jgi:hypothetical protein